MLLNLVQHEDKFLIFYKKWVKQVLGQSIAGTGKRSIRIIYQQAIYIHGFSTILDACITYLILIWSEWLKQSHNDHLSKWTCFLNLPADLKGTTTGISFFSQLFLYRPAQNHSIRTRTDQIFRVVLCAPMH